MTEAIDTQSPSKQGVAEWEPKVVAFLCSYCSYTSADLAGTSQIQYPPNVRIIRVPCSGRINPLFVIRSLQEGADGVLVAGCRPGNCHYRNGNMLAQRRFSLLKNALEHIGLEPERLHFAWLGASQADKFVRLVTDAVESAKALGPAKVLVKAKV